MKWIGRAKDRSKRHNCKETFVKRTGGKGNHCQYVEIQLVYFKIDRAMVTVLYIGIDISIF